MCCRHRAAATLPGSAREQRVPAGQAQQRVGAKVLDVITRAAHAALGKRDVLGPQPAERRRARSRRDGRTVGAAITAPSPLRLQREQVHRRRADEARDERVRRRS